MSLWVAAATVLVGNVPFGYWRANVPRFSVQWVLAIHVPVALALLLRVAAHVPFEPATLGVMVGAFFLGQTAGQKARATLAGLLPARLTSCLVWDLARALRG